MRKQSQPPWRVLLAFMLLMVGLLVLVERASLSSGSRLLAQAGIVLLVYGLLGLWLWSHAEFLTGTVQDEKEWFEEEALTNSTPGAPPLTPRQVHFRRVMGRRFEKRQQP
ncbi:MAG: hypothetical protein M5U01_30460 [Ardenticatenaceae bacterium]|nr:hypothetical protein [Ardenticatenaceae bacterium]